MFLPHRKILIKRQGKKEGRCVSYAVGWCWGGVVANSVDPSSLLDLLTSGGVDHPKNGWNVGQVDLHLIGIPYNHTNEQMIVVGMVGRSSAADESTG